MLQEPAPTQRLTLRFPSKLLMAFLFDQKETLLDFSLAKSYRRSNWDKSGGRGEKMFYQTLSTFSLGNWHRETPVGLPDLSKIGRIYTNDRQTHYYSELNNNVLKCTDVEIIIIILIINQQYLSKPKYIRRILLFCFEFKEKESLVFENLKFILSRPTFKLHIQGKRTIGQFRFSYATLTNDSKILVAS